MHKNVKYIFWKTLRVHVISTNTLNFYLARYANTQVLMSFDIFILDIKFCILMILFLQKLSNRMFFSIRKIIKLTQTLKSYLFDNYFLIYKNSPWPHCLEVKHPHKFSDRLDNTFFNISLFMLFFKNIQCLRNIKFEQLYRLFSKKHMLQDI